MKSHRDLFCVLFAILETLLFGSLALFWSVNPRAFPALSEAAGVAFWFSFAGLSLVCWLIRRLLPRLARVGLATLVLAILAGSLLPAVP